MKIIEKKRARDYVLGGKAQNEGISQSEKKGKYLGRGKNIEHTNLGALAVI